MKDDLSSSVGAVMDLLGMYQTLLPVFHLTSIQVNSWRTTRLSRSSRMRRNRTDTSAIIWAWLTNSSRHPITQLAPTLFPFFRHTIANVRLAVVKTLHTFMTVHSLPRGWISISFLRLLLQNLLVEERSDIRESTLATWREVLSILSTTSGWMESSLTQGVLLEWYAVLMTPLGLPLDASSFHDPTVGADNGGPSERHNVDKNMLAQDLSLVPVEVVIQARLAASEALALIIAFWPSSVRHDVGSNMC